LTSFAPPCRDTALPNTAEHWLTEERLRAYSGITIAIFLAFFVGWTALSLPDLIDPRGKPVGYDFMAFWSAARLALEGRPEAVFDWTVIETVHRAAVPGLQGTLFPWHYPPTFLLAVLPLGLMSYPAALAVFSLAGLALWAALIGRVLPDRRAWIVAAAAPAGLVNVLNGQNGFLTAALAGFALLLLDRRPLSSGILIGLLAIKPHLAVLFPVALAASGRWRTFVAASATVAVLIVTTLLAFGWGTTAAFLQDLPTVRQVADNGWVPWGLMPSAHIFMRSLGASPSAAMLAQVAAAACAALCVWCAWRKADAPFEAKAATLVAGSLLVSPYLFHYDLTWAALAAAWLALLGWRTGFRRAEREILIAAFVVPVAMIGVYAITSVQIGALIVFALLLTATLRAVGSVASSTAAGVIWRACR
jgi:hypothetical protein